MRIQGRRIYSIDRIPSGDLDAPPNGAVWNAALSCPLRRSHGSVANRDLNIGAFVSGLLVSADPMAIFGTVPEIVVASVKLKSDGKGSIHIGHEVSDVVPSRADLDSSATVTLPAFIGRIVTTPHHVVPAMIEPVAPESVFDAAVCHSFTTTIIIDDRDNNLFHDSIKEK